MAFSFFPHFLPQSCPVFAKAKWPNTFVHFFFFTWKGKKTNKQTVRWWLIRVNMIRVVMSCEQSWRAASVGGEVERRTLADDTAGVVEYLREDTSMVHVSAPNSLDTVHETVRLMVGTTVILCVTLPLRKGLSSSWRTKSSTVHLPFLSTVFFFFFYSSIHFLAYFPKSSPIIIIIKPAVHLINFFLKRLSYKLHHMIKSVLRELL